MTLGARFGRPLDAPTLAVIRAASAAGVQRPHLPGEGGEGLKVSAHAVFEPAQRWSPLPGSSFWSGSAGYPPAGSHTSGSPPGQASAVSPVAVTATSV
mgnify:CR=1 FL=1